VDRLFERERKAGHADGLFEEMEAWHVSIRQRVARIEWQAQSDVDLLRLRFTACFIECFAKDLQSPARLIYGLLLTESGGFQPFVYGATYLEASRPLEEELQRRQYLHFDGAVAGGLAVAMKAEFLRNRPEVENTIEYLKTRIRVPLSATEHRDSLPTQIALTLLEQDVTDPIRVLIEGIRGQLDTFALAVSRDLANMAEKDRRWYGREGKHAKGPARLEVGIEPDAERSTGPEAHDETEARLALEHEVDAMLQAADEQEARGSIRRAQQIRSDLYHRRLGGKARRTPEIRNRRTRKG
jgi:hypothetical protein